MPEPLGISIADALDAADHDLVALLDTFKTHTPVEWQVFLRRVDDLQQMALEPRRGETGDCAVDGFGRRQEIPDEYELCRARQRLEGGQAGTIGLIAIDQLGDPRQCNPSADRGHAAAEHGEALAAADEEARQRKEKQLGTVALGWPLGARHVIGRSVIHRRRGVPPQPYALRRLPFGFADIKPLRLGALAPVDAGRRVARFILAELPEGLPLANTPASVHALSDGDGYPLGRDEERRQHGRGLLRPVAQRGGRRGAARQKPRAGKGLGQAQRSGAEICSITRATVTPSARPAKLTAMRCRRTGGAKARTSSIEGLNRPSINARARQASIRAWLARGPGPHDTKRRTPSIPVSSGLPERTSERIASTTLSPTGMRRTRRCAAISSATFIAGRGRSSRIPVVAISICRSASRSG